MGRRYGSRALATWVSRHPWWRWGASAIIAFGGLRALAVLSEPGSVERAVGLVGQFVVPAILLVAMALSAWFKTLRQRRLAEFRATQWHSALSSLGGIEFRQLVSEAMQREGAVLQDLSRDDAARGVDLILRQGRQFVLVRCRHWPDAKAGMDHLRLLERACAAHKGALGVMATSGDFTFTARAYARDRNIRLIDGALLREMLADLPLENFSRASQSTAEPSRTLVLPDHAPGHAPASQAPTAPLSMPMAWREPRGV